MAFTKLYLTNRTAPYTPATLRGAWDQTAQVVTRALDSEKQNGGAVTFVSAAETNASGTWDVLNYRGVSGPLAAQTISGTVNVCIQNSESNAAADDYWHVHIYVTQGDSDTPRGTILTDYVENSTNEWPTSGSALALQSAQTLSSLAISAGDRLVLEIGYIARNTSTTSRTGSVEYGTQDATTLATLADQALASATTGAQFIEFSSSITEAAVTDRISQYFVEVLAAPLPAARVTQEVVEVLTSSTPQARVTQVVVEVLQQSIYGPATITISKPALSGAGESLGGDGSEIISRPDLSGAGTITLVGAGGVAFTRPDIAGEILVGPIQLTQMGRQVLTDESAPMGRLTQMGRFAVTAESQPGVRLTQIGRQVLYPIVCEPGDETPTPPIDIPVHVTQFMLTPRWKLLRFDIKPRQEEGRGLGNPKGPTTATEIPEPTQWFLERFDIAVREEGGLVDDQNRTAQASEIPAPASWRLLRFEIEQRPEERASAR